MHCHYSLMPSQNGKCTMGAQWQRVAPLLNQMRQVHDMLSFSAAISACEKIDTGSVWRHCSMSRTE
eukprot:3020571-Karenia_brevis.AAC.1